MKRERTNQDCEAANKSAQDLLFFQKTRSRSGKNVVFNFKIRINVKIDGTEDIADARKDLPR